MIEVHVERNLSFNRYDVYLLERGPGLRYLIAADGERVALGESATKPKPTFSLREDYLVPVINALLDQPAVETDNDEIDELREKYDLVVSALVGRVISDNIETFKDQGVPA